MMLMIKLKDKIVTHAYPQTVRKFVGKRKNPMPENFAKQN
jgi:hypothetical protein